MDSLTIALNAAGFLVVGLSFWETGYTTINNFYHLSGEMTAE